VQGSVRGSVGEWVVWRAGGSGGGGGGQGGGGGPPRGRGGGGLAARGPEPREAPEPAVRVVVAVGELESDMGGAGPVAEEVVVEALRGSCGGSRAGPRPETPARAGRRRPRAGTGARARRDVGDSGSRWFRHSPPSRQLLRGPRLPASPGSGGSNDAPSAVPGREGRRGARGSGGRGGAAGSAEDAGRGREAGRGSTRGAYARDGAARGPREAPGARGGRATFQPAGAPARVRPPPAPR